MTVSRRGLLAAGGVIGVASVAAACGGGGSDSSSSSAAPASSPAGPAVDLGPVSDVPVGGGVIYDTEQVVVTQPQAGTIKGFSAVCPHQGCLVGSVADNQIVCPCHGSVFSAEDGAVLQGPAKAGLAAAPVSVEGDQVLLG